MEKRTRNTGAGRPKGTSGEYSACEKLRHCPDCNFVWGIYGVSNRKKPDYFGLLPSYGLERERCPSCTKRMLEGVPIYPVGNKRKVQYENV